MGSSGYMTWEKEERRKQSFLPFPRRKHDMLATEERINMGEDVYTDAVSFSIRGKLKQFLKLKISRTKKMLKLAHVVVCIFLSMCVC